jgi:hypothetical protein
MRVIRRPSGRPLGLLDEGEQLPAGAPRDVLQKRGDFWYMVAGTNVGDKRPRDPATGDPLPRGNARVKEEKMARTETREQDANPAREKGIRASVRDRKRASRVGWWDPYR